MNYVPCIFSLLPCWASVPGISFRFHGAGNAVFYARFPCSVCLRHVVRAASAVVFVHAVEEYFHQVAVLVVIHERAVTGEHQAFLPGGDVIEVAFLDYDV